MHKIPVHKLSEKFNGEMAMLRYVSENDHLPAIDYAHRDDYYIFLFLEKGKGKMIVDFEEYELTGSSIYCILPGQIHFPINHIKASGWILAIDSMFVKDEYKEVFENTFLIEKNRKLAEEEIAVLSYCISLIHKRLYADRQHIEEAILHDLSSFYIGMIAEIYQKGLPLSINNRFTTITSQFKKLLTSHYKSLKRPSQYASLLNISSVYLNEAVKNTTGLSVSECIQNEIILHAKRLLYYTNLSIKEIALELGYEDYAYFTRLFTKSATISPTQFRKKYLK